MIDVIIIHSNSDPYRERNLNFLIKYYRGLLPKSTITVVEQNTTTKNNIISNYVDNYIRFETENDLFCRSASLNNGFKNTNNDYIIFSDNDCVVDSSILKHINNYINIPIILPYNYPVINLNEFQTQEFVNDYNNFDLNRNDLITRGFVSNGGVLFIKRDCFYFLGGYDPRFIGWGGEDDAFIDKSKFYYNIVRLNNKLIHLNHPRISHSKESTPEYQKNYMMYLEYRKADKSKIDSIRKEIGFKHLEK